MLYPHFFFSLFLSFVFFQFYFLSIWVWLLELIRYSESVFFLPVRGQQLVVENLSLLYIPGYARLLCRPLSEIREGASKSGEMAKRDERIPKERERETWFHSTSSLRIENKKMKSIVLCQFLRRPEGKKSRSVHSLLANTHTGLY